MKARDLAVPVLAFVGGWAASKLLVLAAATLASGNAGSDRVVKGNAEGAAAMAGALSPVVSYLAQGQPNVQVFASGLGAGAAMSALKVSTWFREAA